jgi:DNA-binding NarL/FixJ family response regulator
MKRSTVIQVLIIAAVSTGALIFLEGIRYRQLLYDFPSEISYLAVASVFFALGYWLANRKSNAHMAHDELQSIREKLELTERELEILEQMEAGLSNQQIADKLFISLSTVKTHVSSNLSKLGVDRRMQALALARELKFFRSTG